MVMSVKGLAQTSCKYQTELVLSATLDYLNRSVILAEIINIKP